MKQHVEKVSGVLHPFLEGTVGMESPRAGAQQSWLCHKAIPIAVTPVGSSLCSAAPHCCEPTGQKAQQLSECKWDTALLTWMGQQPQCRASTAGLGLMGSNVVMPVSVRPVRDVTLHGMPSGQLLGAGGCTVQGCSPAGGAQQAGSTAPVHL